MKPWYKRWWGVLFLILVALAVLFFFVFSILVLRAVNDIREGRTPGQNYTAARVGGAAKKPATQRYDVATKDDPFTGPANAKVTVVEFSDFQCPYCRQAFPIVRELQVAYKDKVKFIYRDFPISETHAYALVAAVAAECAHDQRQFWPYHDRLFINQERLDVASLKNYARQVGLDEVRFNTCLESGRAAFEVEADLADGIAAGVEGTPTWFINGRRVTGLISYETFKQLIEAELAK